jgi:autotransporter-associated beta strand protein
VKYCSNYSNRIDFLYTDGHPAEVITNSLYEMYYQNGAFYKTDGTFITNFSDLPILKDSGQGGSAIYQYSTTPQSDPNQWIPGGRAWCWDIGYQTNGYPVCVFTVQLVNATGSNQGYLSDRIYYYYARWTGTNWQKRFIAQAGRPLYSSQEDYAGGICLDAQDVNTVYISSDAANSFDLSSITNVPLEANYEIYRGVTTNGGLTFTWQPITGNSIVDNLRPYVPRTHGGEPCVLWFRGTYNSYTSFNTEIVGLFTTRVPQTNGPVGTWIADADGVWSDASKWAQGIIPDSATVTADFSELNNMSTNHAVTLDSSRTIGGLKFGDLAGTWNWLIDSSRGSTLTLGGTPLITVNDNTATLSASLAGTSGFTKTGPGTLVLNASNSLSGALNLDSGSTSADDGAVRVTSSTALANIASPITFRNNTGSDAVGSFQLDGSNGGITVTQEFSTSCRNNNTVPTFENLAGTNFLVGFNSVQVGGTNVIYQADAGSLLWVTAPIQYVGSLTASRFFTFTGNGDMTVSAPILAAANGATTISLVKTGNGCLWLNGANTYTGTTTIAAGTLGGDGVISGSVIVEAGAALAPGASSIGSLTINGNLTIGGNLAFRVNTSQIPPNDMVAVGGTLQNAGRGTVAISNTGPALAVGDTFHLFNKAVLNGGALAVTGAGVQWTNNLAADGSIGVLSVIPTNPTNITFRASGGILSLAWPSTYLGWVLQAQTNALDVGLSTNWVDVPGSGFVTSTNLTINPASPVVFFRLRH